MTRPWTCESYFKLLTELSYSLRRVGEREHAMISLDSHQAKALLFLVEGALEHEGIAEQGEWLDRPLGDVSKVRAQWLKRHHYLRGAHAVNGPWVRNWHHKDREARAW